MNRLRPYLAPGALLVILALWLLVPELGFAQSAVSSQDITTRACALQNTLLDAILRLFGGALFVVGLIVGGILQAMRGMASGGSGAGPMGMVLGFFAEHALAALMISVVGIFGGVVLTSLSLIGCG